MHHLDVGAGQELAAPATCRARALLGIAARAQDGKLLDRERLIEFSRRSCQVPRVMLLMLGFLRRRKRQQTENDPIAGVAVHLAIGYTLTPYGAGVALLGCESGYNEVETASHIALTTMARDLKEAGSDISKLLAFVPHARASLELLKEAPRMSGPAVTGGSVADEDSLV